MQIDKWMPSERDGQTDAYKGKSLKYLIINWLTNRLTDRLSLWLLDSRWNLHLIKKFWIIKYKVALRWNSIMTQGVIISFSNVTNSKKLFKATLWLWTATFQRIKTTLWLYKEFEDVFWIVYSFTLWYWYFIKSLLIAYLKKISYKINFLSWYF